MKKIFLIGFKDLTLVFRDRTALILMLLAPFVLTLGLGLVTGNLGSSNSSGISDIPVIIVNQDGGQLGNALVEVFQSSDLEDLIEPTLSDDYAAARQSVDNDESAAAILIPAGFSDSIIPQEESSVSSDVVQIELYGNPTRSTSVSVVQTILESFLNQLETSRAGGFVIIGQMVNSGMIQSDETWTYGEAYGESKSSANSGTSSIALDTITGQGETTEVNTLAMLAPGMALMFLMYTTSNGGRSLLIERNQGTLSRLAVSPTRINAVLGGKVFGIFLTGLAQMGILISASSLLYGLDWGDPLGLVILILGCVAGATGWGLLLCAIANTPGQISSIGSALMLTFGILGGSFFSLDRLPAWAQWLAHVSPNAWGMDGFTTLALGGSLANLGDTLLGLTVMALLLFVISSFIINLRGIVHS